MNLQAACSGLDLLNESRRQACIPFADEAKIHEKGIHNLEHPRNMPGSWSASRGSRSNRWPCPTAHQRGEARIKRLLDLLRADVMDMRVDAAGGDNVTFTGDHLGSWT